MWGIIWRIGEIAKNIENIMFFNDFSEFGGRTWPHFLIVSGLVLGSILEPFGLPNGVNAEGFGGSILGLFLSCFS